MRGMRGQAGFFDIEERLKELSAKGDTLERLNGLVDLAFPAGSGEGCAAGRPLPRRPSSFRPCADVPGADPAGQPQPVGRAGRVSDQGPAFVRALSRARV